MTLQQISGGILGLAIGDALGVPVEFRDRAILKRFPVVDMREFGTHHQPKGTWSDDSSLAFCLIESLIEKQTIDYQHIGTLFCKWYYEGFWTPHGRVFDIGLTTSSAISKIANGHPAELAGENHEDSNGNGSLMRILPLAFILKAIPIEKRFEFIDLVSSITHGHVRSSIACFYYIEFALQILQGKDKFEIYEDLKAPISNFLSKRGISTKEISFFKRLLNNDIFLFDEIDIKSTGYVLHTLEASIWCLLTSKNYSETVLKAVNLGEDTDTTGCVAGGLAGLLYERNGIPKQWLKQLVKIEQIEDLSKRFTEVLPYITLSVA